MEMLPVKPERKAQLENYAHRHEQDTAAALDEVLANYLEWRSRTIGNLSSNPNHRESVQAILKGYEDVKADAPVRDRFSGGVAREYCFPL